MKNRVIFGALCMLLMPMAHAESLIIGTPGDAYSLPPTQESPILGGTLLNFSTLTPFATYSTYTSQGISISSPDGLEVLPYSTQTVNPNELYDTSADGSADIKITDGTPLEAIAVGIADSDVDASNDPVTIYLQALNSSGVGFGTLFSVTIPENTTTAGNGYYAIEDSSADIYGLQITQPVGNAALYSGLAISDVQAVTPEPSSFLLLATGLAGLCLFGLKKFRQA
jgi:PEP-CTERM motif